MPVLRLIECKKCGMLEMTLHNFRAENTISAHKNEYPQHTLTEHRFEPDTSRKL